MKSGTPLSSCDKRVHFGLGYEPLAQSIKIRWPSGVLQTLKNVSANQVLQIAEPFSQPARK
jgi:enediyne biosynthesis protein E4